MTGESVEAWTRDELRTLHSFCDWRTEEGTTPDGMHSVRASYRCKGNWDIYLDDKYVGTLWYG